MLPSEVFVLILSYLPQPKQLKLRSLNSAFLHYFENEYIAKQFKFYLYVDSIDSGKFTIEELKALLENKFFQKGSWILSGD